MQLAQYQSVIDLYKLRWVDFDIEGQAVAQPDSYDRRNRVLARLQVRAQREGGQEACSLDLLLQSGCVAQTTRPMHVPPCVLSFQQPYPLLHCLAAQAVNPGLPAPSTLPTLPTGLVDALPLLPPRHMQAANPGLTVSFTLPVLPAGLTADGVRLLESCVSHGVRVDVLNIMSMDYGDSAAPGGQCLWVDAGCCCTAVFQTSCFASSRAQHHEHGLWRQRGARWAVVGGRLHYTW